MLIIMIQNAANVTNVFTMKQRKFSRLVCKVMREESSILVDICSTLVPSQANLQIESVDIMLEL